MRRIHSEQVIDEVRNVLGGYFRSGKLDESIFYPVIRQCLSRIGEGIYEEAEAILEISGYQARLPKDFYKVKLAVGCSTWELTEITNPSVWEEERTLCEVTGCEPYKVEVDANGNFKKIVQILPIETRRWTDFTLLKVEKSSVPLCSNDCFNFQSKSAEEFTISNGALKVNFDYGLVYMVYLKTQELEDGYMLPDNETVLTWIKDKMIYEAFKVLVYSGEPNMTNQLKMAEKELYISEENAKRVWKANEFHTFYEVGNAFRRRYTQLANTVIDGTRYARRNGI